MRVEARPGRRPRQGGPQSLLLVKTLAQMTNTVRMDFEVAILQARRDGWSLRELSQHLDMSYSSVKRYSEAARSRGQ